MGGNVTTADAATMLASIFILLSGSDITLETVISCIDPYPDKALLLPFYLVAEIKLCWHSLVQSALMLTTATSTAKAQRESGINTAARKRFGGASVIRVR